MIIGWRIIVNTRNLIKKSVVTSDSIIVGSVDSTRMEDDIDELAKFLCCDVRFIGVSEIEPVTGDEKVALEFLAPLPVVAGFNWGDDAGNTIGGDDRERFSEKDLKKVGTTFFFSRRNFMSLFSGNPFTPLP